jgi:hypothetical protein
MKYELIKYDIGIESDTDEEGNYSANITLALHPTDDIAPDFSKDIVVVSNNNMNGYEVDKQRQSEIEEYIKKINIESDKNLVE